MKETGAALVGEPSGHICFADGYYGFDDALYAACRLGELWRKRTSSDLERAGRHFSAGYDVIAVDGVRVLFGDGWGLIRASNTQPVIVARYEARSAEREIRAVMEE